jgi:hypothetical protein
VIPASRHSRAPAILIARAISADCFVLNIVSTSFYRAFGPCGVELLAHVAQRLFPSDSIVLQTIEVDSTVADPVDIGTLGVEVNPRADAEQVAA